MEKTAFLWALACCCALLYLDHMGQRWNFQPQPLFRRREISQWLPGICMGLLAGWLISSILSGALGWVWLFYAAVAWLGGGSLVAYLLRRLTGPVTMVAAPLLTAATFAAPWFK